jgi:hypothetical protein
MNCLKGAFEWASLTSAFVIQSSGNRCGLLFASTVDALVLNAISPFLKSEKRFLPLHKVAIIIGALALALLTTLRFATTSLGARLGITLSAKEVFLVAGCYLALCIGKAFIPNRIPIPSPPSLLEIQNMGASRLEEWNRVFTQWLYLDALSQLAFLQRSTGFIYPFFSHSTQNLSDTTIRQYIDILWAHIPPEERLTLSTRCYSLDLPPPQNIQHVDLQTLPCMNWQKPIDAILSISENQMRWLLLIKPNDSTLSCEEKLAYINSLHRLRFSQERDQLFLHLSLSLETDPAAIHGYQLLGYFFFACHHTEEWKQLAFATQWAYYQKFLTLEGIDLKGELLLYLNSEVGPEQVPDEALLTLNEQFQRHKHSWLILPRKLQEGLNRRLPTSHETPDFSRVEAFTDETIKAYHMIFHQNPEAHKQFQIDVQKAFSARFMALHLPPPNQQIPVDFPNPPTTPTEVNEMNEFYLLWFYNFARADWNVWKNLPIRVQVACNQRFCTATTGPVLFALNKLTNLPSTEDVENEDDFYKLLIIQYKQYPSLWLQLSEEIQEALKKHRTEFEVLLTHSEINNHRCFDEITIKCYLTAFYYEPERWKELDEDSKFFFTRKYEDLCGKVPEHLQTSIIEMIVDSVKDLLPWT